MLGIVHLSHLPGRLAQKHHYQPTSKREQFQYEHLAGKSHSLWNYHQGLLTLVRCRPLNDAFTPSGFTSLTTRAMTCTLWWLSWKFRTGRLPGFPGYPQIYWAQRCRHSSLPSVSEALGDLHREHSRVNSAALLSLHQNSHKHGCTNGAALTPVTFPIPEAQTVWFTDPCAAKRLINYW